MLPPFASTAMSCQLSAISIPTVTLDEYLDEAAALRVLDCLGDAVSQSGAAALMVTHSPLAAARADRVLRLVHGRLEVSSPASRRGPQ